MEEKELIRRIRNSIKAKKSQAEILSGLQGRGYKLAYADKLITKAMRPKRIAIISLIFLIAFLGFTFSAHAIFNQQKIQIPNPLRNFTITSNVVATPPHQTTYDQIKITPDIITFFLNEIGAWGLHKNPLTLENPVINFKIGTKDFHSEIGSKIKTTEGLSEDADLQFDTNKQNIIDTILSSNPEQNLRQLVISDKIQIELKTTEAELFAKGYFNLYNSLK